MGGGCPGWSTIVYMSSGLFRGKESSNRIEISRLVQDLLNFGLLGSLQLWGRGRWVGGVWGHLGHRGCPTHTHMHAHAHTHMYTCIEIANGRRHGGIHVYHVQHACACMHACVCMCEHVCVHETPPTTPIHTLTPIHPSATPPQRGGSLESVKIW